MSNVIRIGFAGLAVMIVGAFSIAVFVLTTAIAAALLLAQAVGSALWGYAVEGLKAMVLALPLLCAWNLGPVALFGATPATYWSAFGIAFLLCLVAPTIQTRRVKLSK